MESTFIVCLKEVWGDLQQWEKPQEWMPSSVTVQDTPSMGEATPVAARDGDCSCSPQEAGCVFQEEQGKQAPSKQKTAEAIHRCVPASYKSSSSSFTGVGVGGLLPTELAVLDSILGDDSVISLGEWVCFTYFSLSWCSINGFLDWGTQGFQTGDIPDSRDPFHFSYRASALRQQSYWSHAAASDPRVLSWYWSVANSPTFQSSSSLRKGKGTSKALL